MTTKQRLKQLEQVRSGGVEEVVFWLDTLTDGNCKLDNELMTIAEAERIIAAYPESVHVIHIISASKQRINSEYIQALE